MKYQETYISKKIKTDILKMFKNRYNEPNMTILEI